MSLGFVSVFFLWNLSSSAFHSVFMLDTPALLTKRTLYSVQCTLVLVLFVLYTVYSVHMLCCCYDVQHNLCAVMFTLPHSMPACTSNWNLKKYLSARWFTLKVDLFQSIQLCLTTNVNFFRSLWHCIFDIYILKSSLFFFNS